MKHPYFIFLLFACFQVSMEIGNLGKALELYMKTKREAVSVTRLVNEEIDKAIIIAKDHISSKHLDPFTLPSKKIAHTTLTKGILKGIGSFKRKGSVNISYKNNVFDFNVPIVFPRLHIFYRYAGVLSRGISKTYCQNLVVKLRIRIDFKETTFSVAVISLKYKSLHLSFGNGLFKFLLDTKVKLIEKSMVRIVGEEIQRKTLKIVKHLLDKYKDSINNELH